MLYITRVTNIALLALALTVPGALGRQHAQSAPRADQITDISTSNGEKTISIYQGPDGTEEYTVSTGTRVFINGRPSSVSQLKRGMIAFVSHQADSTQADQIAAIKRVRR